MSALFRVSIGAIAIGLCSLPLGTVVAQQSAGTRGSSDFKTGQSQSPAANTVGTAQSTQGNLPGSSESRATNNSAAPQIDRAQSGRSTTARQYSANFRGPQANAAGASQESDKFFANCLLTHNQGEVELSEIAQQKAQNPEVKQFAQQMIKDHRQMIEQLQQVAGTQAGATHNRSSEASSSTSTNSNNDSSSAAPGAATGTESNNANRTSGDLPGSSGASRTTAQSGTAGSAAATEAADSTRSLTATTAGDSGAVSHIGQIEQQIAQRCQQMAKDELQQKEGAEFDKCYIGNAVGAHMHAVAALEVIGKSSQGQLAQIAQAAQPTVQQHLDRAKELMKQLEGEKGSNATAGTRSGSNDNSQAERSSSSGTQRQ
ncbi:MAG: DUF4142 domain-containing protein [Pirellulales bacterium]